MFLARLVFFRLHESPRYLVHAGRPQDAIKSLQLISRFNGSDISIELEDVRDHQCHDVPVTTEEDFSKFDVRSRANSITPFATNVVPGGRMSITKDSSSENSQSSQSVVITDYASTGETPNRGSSTPEQHVSSDSPTEPMLKEVAATLRRDNLHSNGQRREPFASRRSSVYEQKMCRALPRWLRRPLRAWWDQVMMILAPEWLRTTLLVWLVWFAMSLGLSITSINFSQSLTIFFFPGYTLFNVFLPKLLENRSSFDVPQTLEQSLWDVMISTIGGCPGAVVRIAFVFVFARDNIYSFLSISHVDWCLPNKIEAGSKMVISRKHVYYYFFLCIICSR